MSTRMLETVLQHSLVNGLDSQEWARPTRECFARADHDLSRELCDILLGRLFAQTHITEPLLERYLAFVTRPGQRVDVDIKGEGEADNKREEKGELVPPRVFLTALIDFAETTTKRNPRQWSQVLHCLPAVLEHVDPDQIISDLFDDTVAAKDPTSWPHILYNVFIMLANLVAAGLPSHSNKSIDDGTKQDLMDTDFSTQTQQQTQQQQQQQQHAPFGSVSQPTAFDPEATLDLASFATEDHPMNSQQVSATQMTMPIEDTSDLLPHGATATQSTTGSTAAIETCNSRLAARIMIDLIEKKSAKRIFEMWYSQKQQQDGQHNEENEGNSDEPWVTCNAILTRPSGGQWLASQGTAHSASTAEGGEIQKLFLLMKRLTDHDVGRRMAVHMKYQELEDEGTARALPSAGLMGFLFHMVQIRPTLSDDYIVDHLAKLQTIKGSFDESFYLELWFAAFTGLREACASAYPLHDKTFANTSGSKNIAIINCILWKTLILVKIPTLIKALEKRTRTHTLTLEYNEDGSIETNPLESSLLELKSFAGLLNGCKCPVTHYFAATNISSKLLAKIVGAAQEITEDDDDIMKLINEMNEPMDTSNPDVIKTLQAAASEDIFTSTVRVCESYGFIRKEIAQKLIVKATPPVPAATTNPSKPANDGNDMDDLVDFLDTDMLDVENEKPSTNIMDDDSTTNANILDENIDSRIESIRQEASVQSLVELMHIALISMVHTRRIVDFLVEFHNAKAASKSIQTLGYLCDAFIECPLIVDVIGQLYHPSMLLTSLEPLCNAWQPLSTDMGEDQLMLGGQMGDEYDGVRSSYQKFGKLWMFINLVMHKFKLYKDVTSVFSDRDGLCYKYFTQGYDLFFGIDASDSHMESVIVQLETALTEEGNLSEALLSELTPQLLIRAMPTVFYRIIKGHAHEQSSTEALLNFTSALRPQYLVFALASGVFSVFCETLLYRYPSSAMTCLQGLLADSNIPALFFTIYGYVLYGCLCDIEEQRRQERLVLAQGSSADPLSQQINDLKDHVRQRVPFEVTPPQQQEHTETVATNVRRDNLFQKTQDMFRNIVKSGRSMFMRDVDAGTTALWESESNPEQQVIAHYLDLVMFQTALNTGGPHWFVSMIVHEVLEAGKCGGAVRAAELGSCLVTTPLGHSEHTSCCNLLRCLVTDIVPSSLHQCALQSASFFQGQTLGVFTSDCMVLMHARGTEADHFCRVFLESLAADNENGPKIIQATKKKTSQDHYFDVWPEAVLKSPVWRGFLKGLMSNPLINEAWPNTFHSIY